MQSHKGQIRRRMLRERLALSPLEVQEHGATVRNLLQKTDVYRSAQCLGCYVSVKNEVDTRGLIRAALQERKRVGVPVTRTAGEMIHRAIRSIADLRPAGFGLLEPPGEGSLEIPPDAFDLIVVPGLAFDRRGNRIGFGAGYYDRFLVRTPALRVALAYDFQVLEHLPTDPHDTPVDFLITEAGVHACSGTAR